MKQKIALLLSAVILLTAVFALPGSASAGPDALQPDGAVERETREPDAPDEGAAQDSEDRDGSGPAEAPGEGDDADPDRTGSQGDEDTEQMGTREETEAESEEAAAQAAAQETRAAAPAAYDDSPLPAGAVQFSAVTVTLRDSDEDVQTLEEVDPYAYISVGFRFEVPDTEGILGGQYAVLTLPDEILVDTGGAASYAVDIPLIGEDVVIATVTLYQDSQEMIFRVTEEIEAYDEIYNGFFSIRCRFNGDEIAGGAQTIVFEIDGVEYPIDVRFRGEDSGLSKVLHEEAFDPDSGRFTQVWKLTANEAGDLLEGLVLSDWIDPGLTYTGFCFAGGGMDVLPSGWTVSGTDAGDPIIFRHDAQTADPVELYLYTEAGDLGAFPASDEDPDFVLAENRASFEAAYAAGGSTGLLEASAMAPLYAGQLRKTGSYTAGDTEIEWTLTIDTRGEALENLVLHDLVPAGVELDPSSITVTDGQNGLAVGPDSGYEANYSSEDAGDAVLWQLAFDAPLSGSWTVSYRTAITNTEAANEFTVENRAWLTWGNEVKSPVQTGSVGASTGIFTKYHRGYNGDNQQLSWGFHINQNYYTIAEEVVVTDRYRLAGNAYEQGNPVIVSVNAFTKGDTTPQPLSEGLPGAGDYSFEVDEITGSFTLTFHAGVLDARYVQVLFYTTLLEREGIVSNENMTYYNEASLSWEGTEYTSNSSQIAAPRVLNKSNRYDRLTQTITWTLTVNPFAYDGLGTVRVTDTLPDEVELVAVYRDAVSDGNLLAAVGSESEIVEDESYRLDGGALTFLWRDGALDGRSAVLEVVTRVRDEVFWENFDEKSVTNRAMIEMDGANRDYTVTSSRSISNALVDKSGEFDPSDGVINWSILINSNALDWEVAEIVLSDPLPDGLLLDVESVSLWRYELVALREDVYAEQLLGEVSFDRASAVRYDIDTNLFEFVFPSDLPGGYLYRLLFDTEVLAAGSYSNEITLTGFAPNPESGGAVIHVQDSEDLSGAMASRKARITLQKFDEDGAPLTGAVFELRSADGGLLETRTSGEDGLIAFSTYLKYDTAYYLLEVEAPAGYVLLEEPIEVYLVRDDDGTLSYTAANRRFTDPSRPSGGAGSSGGNGGEYNESSGSGGAGGGSSNSDSPAPPDPVPDDLVPDDPGAPDAGTAGGGTAGDNDNPSTGAGGGSTLPSTPALFGALCLPAAAVNRYRGNREEG